MTTWYDNWSTVLRGYPNCLLGGMKGFGRHTVISRHCASACKPGLWSIGIAVGTEVFELFDLTKASVPAVQDDFGNLVRVQQ